MPKNIVIFSDGTGQAGGLTVDERRSNVYKLFRATRCGPDSTIDPAGQLAFYDPGLGSRRENGDKIGVWRRVYNVLSQATGLGLTRNIVDCYAAIIKLWEPGDRIYLFGFSRGAYTVRCVGGVLGLCGVPSYKPGSAPFKLDAASVEKVATEAVKSVYQYGNALDGDPLRDERLERARRFRQKYGSDDGSGGPNTAPYFIGVWDTVAALGIPASGPMLVLLGAIGVVFGLGFFTTALWAIIAASHSLLGTPTVGFSLLFAMMLPIGFLGVAAVLAWKNVYLFAGKGPNRRAIRIASSVRAKFYDKSLGARVRFARHALSIDERRRDFKRVQWTLEPGSGEPRDGGVPRVRQVWFAGNHSDVGGSYEENESRLSDIALEWMVHEAKGLPEPILVNEAYLHLFPSHAGPQHDEVKAGFAELPSWLRTLFRWDVEDRLIKPEAPLHESVVRRFEAPSVLIYDVVAPYRPAPLRSHPAVECFYRS